VTSSHIKVFGKYIKAEVPCHDIQRLNKKAGFVAMVHSPLDWEKMRADFSTYTHIILFCLIHFHFFTNPYKVFLLVYLKAVKTITQTRGTF
jgi:hypothetical protein